MARGYMSRLIAASVSQHTAPMPEPTKADFSAKVYDQAWQADSGTVTRRHELWLTGAQVHHYVSFNPDFPEGAQLRVKVLSASDLDVASYEGELRAFLAEIDAAEAALRKAVA